MSDETEDKALLAKWLAEILEDRRLSVNKAAKETRISKTQIGRYLSGEGSMPSLAYIKRIGNLAPHIHAPIGLLPSANGTSTPRREKDVIQLEVDDNCPIELKPKTPEQIVFRLKTRAIEMPPYCYLPGDILLLDRSLTKPKAGKAVCAEIYNLQDETRETVFRAWDPPYLMIATNDPKVPRTPIYVDGEKVAILGTVVRSLRISE